MNQKTLLFLYLITILPFFLASFSARAAMVTGIDFHGTSDPAQVDINTDQPIVFEKTENLENRQIVLDLKGATLPRHIARKIDTSSFNSNVSLISPYQLEGQEGVRVVIQMRKSGGGEVSQDGNNLSIRIPMGAAPDLADKEVTSSTVDTPVAIETAQAGAKTKAAASSLAANSGVEFVDKKSTKLKKFEDSQITRRYFGKPITINVRNVEAQEVFRLIADASGFNVIITEEIKERVTLSLTDVPWDQVLDLVLHQLRLGAERNNNVLRIAPLEAIRREKAEEFSTAQASIAASPRVTKIFPISNATVKDMKESVEALLNSGSTSSVLVKPLVYSDSRTNSLVIQDYVSNIEKAKKLIEFLDIQTPQVLIEAKVIEASETFSKSINGGVSVAFDRFAVSSNGTPLPFQDLVSGGLAGSSFPILGDAANKATLGGSLPNVSFIPGLRRLNALFQWGESESLIKVVSSPRSVVLNGQTSSILQETGFIRTTVVISPLTGLPQSVLTADKVTLRLDVTPTANSDGNVLLKLKIERGVVQEPQPGQFAPADRLMETLVLVESGSTLVIGGVYNAEESTATSGVPFLSKIPILGALFGLQSEGSRKTELFFFITPRIVNAKEAGITG